MGTPRLRMFAGPNGSGKSTLKTVLPAELLGVYINPDEIEKNLSEHGRLDLGQFGLGELGEAAAAFVREAPFLKSIGFENLEQVYGERRKFFLGAAVPDSYLCSTLAAFLRKELVRQGVSLTLETVMSHPSKVELLKSAQKKGYRTYLYYIATEDPEINRNRVRNRVRLGGHDVPDEKIASRFLRSLDLLPRAIRYTDRAYIFDNSTDNHLHTWIAEITDGKNLELKADRIPAWFQRALLDRI